VALLRADEKEVKEEEEEGAAARTRRALAAVDHNALRVMSVAMKNKNKAGRPGGIMKKKRGGGRSTVRKRKKARAEGTRRREPGVLGRKN
jgi:spore germination protein GerM